MVVWLVVNVNKRASTTCGVSEWREVGVYHMLAFYHMVRKDGSLAISDSLMVA